MGVATRPDGTQRAGRWRLDLLGEPALVAADGRRIVLERKDSALLALVALEGPQPRASVAALLWPDADALKARRNLRQRVFRLQRHAGTALFEATEPIRFSAVVTVALDAAEATLADDPSACAGELLGVFDYDDCSDFAAWLDGARERWRERRYAWLTAQAADCERRADQAGALQRAERLCADEPLRELGHRLAMRLHYLRGDHAAALAAYTRCRRLLRDELGASPAPETEALAALVRRAGVPGSAPPAPDAALLRPPRIVGRQPVWRRVQRAWRAGGVLLLRGEPGLGKTRLVQDFARSLGPQRAAGSWLCEVGAHAGDAGVPYALLGRWLEALLGGPGTDAAAHPLAPSTRAELARLLPALGPAPRAPLTRVRLERALDDTLRDAIARGLAGVVVEDLHFADAASLELLPCLAATEGLPWLLTLRPGEQPAAIDAWLGQQAGEGVDTLDMPPLGVAATRELLASLALPGVDAAVLAPALQHHAGGNPLFMLETLRAWRSAGARGPLPAPPAVQTLIERRLRQLPAPALALARVAALAGPDFGAALAVEVLGCAPIDLAGPWLELESAQLLHGERFAHDLVRTAALRSVPRPVARLLHAAIAAALVRRAAPPARIAVHHAAAQDWAAAGAAWQAAAEAAGARSRLAEQADALTQADRCFARAGLPSQRLQVLARHFDTALVVEALDHARRIVRRMRRIVRSDAERAEAAIAAAALHNLAWDGARARIPAAQALRLAAGTTDPALQLRATLQLATAEALTGQADAALARLQPWLDRLDALPDDDVLACDALGCQARVLEAADRRNEAVAAYTATVERALAQERHATAHAALTDQAVALYYLGELEASLAAYERARALRDRIDGGKGWSRLDDMALGGHYRELGRFAEALALLEPTASALRDEGHAVWAVNAGHELAATWLALGQTARARHALGELPAGCPDWLRASRLVAQARIERASGRPAAALLAEALKLLGPRFGRSYVRLRIEVEWLAEADAGFACQRLEAIRAETVQRQQFGLLRLVAVQQIDALLRAGRSVEAGRLAAQDRTLFEQRAPVVVHAPLAWWTLHRAFAAAGLDADAAQALARARQWIREQALPNVPAPFQEGFLLRQRVHAAVLQAAQAGLAA
jgi:DNA-binding SARP family transcriptional activator